MGDLEDSKGWGGEDGDEGQDIPVPVVVVAVVIVIPWLSALSAMAEPEADDDAMMKWWPWESQPHNACPSQLQPFLLAQALRLHLDRTSTCYQARSRRG
jgi:hypothetical protein